MKVSLSHRATFRISLAHGVGLSALPTNRSVSYGLSVVVFFLHIPFGCLARPRSVRGSLSLQSLGLYSFRIAFSLSDTALKNQVFLTCIHRHIVKEKLVAVKDR